MTDMPPSGIIVTMAHVRAAGFCARGARLLAARHGADWTLFLRDGAAVEVVEDLNDAFAQRVAQIARAEAAHG